MDVIVSQITDNSTICSTMVLVCNKENIKAPYAYSPLVRDVSMTLSVNVRLHKRASKWMNSCVSLNDITNINVCHTVHFLRHNYRKIFTESIPTCFFVLFFSRHIQNCIWIEGVQYENKDKHNWTHFNLSDKLVTLEHVLIKLLNWLLLSLQQVSINACSWDVFILSFF